MGSKAVIQSPCTAWLTHASAFLAPKQAGNPLVYGAGEPSHSTSGVANKESWNSNIHHRKFYFNHFTIRGWLELAISWAFGIYLCIPCFYSQMLSLVCLQNCSALQSNFIFADPRCMFWGLHSCMSHSFYSH